MPNDSPAAERLIAASQAEHGGEVVEAFGFPLNDSGNAARFAKAYGRQVRFCADFGEKGWLYLHQLPAGGAVWRRDNIGAVDRFAKDVAANIVANRAVNENLDQLKQWAHTSQQSGGLSAMKRWAQSEILTAPDGKEIARIPVTATEFDQDPWLLNLQNGTYDLRTDELRKPRAEDLLMKIASCSYDADAPATRWRTFLDIVIPDKEYQRVLREGIAYSLTGLTAMPKAFFVLWGASGDNGKSTFIETIMAMLGDYTKATTINTFLESRSPQEHNIAALAGTRFISAPEPNEDAKLDFATLKRVSGGDRLHGCHKYGHPFEFDPTFKLWISTNPEPNISRADNAFFNRYYLIPFTVRIEGKRRELIRELCEGSRDLKEVFREELPGILNWALEGLPVWRESRNIEKPKAMLEVIARSRADQDVLADFLETVLIDVRTSEPSAKISKGEAHEAFKDYCKDNRVKVITKGIFGRMLKDRGFNADGVHIDTTQNGKQVWWGLRRRDAGETNKTSVGEGKPWKHPGGDDGLFE
jgi:putative DNA primase/helicase